MCDMQEFFTNEQIDELITVFKIPGEESNETIKLINTGARESLREELLKIKFVGTDMSFQKFKEDVKEEIFKCQLEPGIPIGDLRGKPVFQGR